MKTRCHIKVHKLFLMPYNSKLFSFRIITRRYNWLIGLMGRVFTHGLGDLGSIPGSRHNKDFKNGT